MSFSSWNLLNIAVTQKTHNPQPKKKKEKKYQSPNQNFLFEQTNPSKIFFFFFLFFLSKGPNFEIMLPIVYTHRRLLDKELTAPPQNGNRTRDSYIGETNFDTNMVIILAALLCALICALGLNSIVRCAMRCSRRFASETPEQAAARLAATGLKKSHLRQLPVAVYGSRGVNIPATECPICLGEFEDGDKVRVLPKCNHGFHVSCIDTWLLSHSSCPNCRHSLLEQQQQQQHPSVTNSSSRQGVAGEQSSATGSGRQGSVVVAIREES